MSNTGGGLVGAFLENSRHYWLQSSALEQTFALFLCTVAAVGVIRAAMVVGALRAPSERTWPQCAAHVRSIRGLLCLTLLTAAWFASLDWFTVLDTEYDHRSRPLAVVVLTAWARVATRLTVPVGVATMLCLAWIVSDGLLRRRGRAAAVPDRLARSEGHLAWLRGLLCLMLLVTLLAALEASAGSFFPYVSEPDGEAMLNASRNTATRLALLLPMSLVICAIWIALDAAVHRRVTRL